jgi:hypothetical protein
MATKRAARKKYKADENRAAIRCVDCPTCGAVKGNQCHYVGFDPLVYTVSNVTTTHRHRVDKYYSRDISEIEKREARDAG